MDATQPLTPAVFEALATLTFGRGDWHARTADALGVSLRNVQYFASGRRPIPAGIGADLRAIIARLAENEGEKRRMTAWLARHAEQGEAMRQALEGALDAPDSGSRSESVDSRITLRR